MNTEPLVTIIMPVRNEARYIPRSLEAVLAQDYPPEKIEILVVDGMSNDGTRGIVAELATHDARVRLLDNPERIVPKALNRAICTARGEIVIRVDGHTIIALDYVSQCVRALAKTRADNVGGPMCAVGEADSARAIALATSSSFGVGNARFHFSRKPTYVDTVYMGAYRHEVFERVGLFDEELVRNQDDEFNYRLIRAGGKVWLDPEIRSIYFSRSTLSALWKQYFEYGFWKVRVIQKHGRPASWRHLVPATFVLTLLISSALSLVTTSPVWFLAVAVPYFLASILASCLVSLRGGWQYLAIVFVAFPTMHLSYGTGFLAGVVRFAFAKGSKAPVSLPQNAN